jgi:hypothetical protein
MKLNLFDRTPWGGQVYQLVNDLRVDFLRNGGKIENFTTHMEESHGIRMNGPILEMDDKWITWMELKYKC